MPNELSEEDTQKVIELLTARMDAAEKKLTEALNTDLYSGGTVEIDKSYKGYRPPFWIRWKRAFIRRWDKMLIGMMFEKPNVDDD